MSPTIPSTTVSRGQAAPAEQQQQQQQQQPPAEDLAAIKAEIDSLKTQHAEAQRAAQFWYDKASKGAEKPAAAETAEPEADVDLLELITTKGAKGLDELLAKRGYVRGDEVDQRVNSKAAQIAKEGELLGRYPDLKKQESEFFKSTAKHYGELKKSGVPEAMAMELAAQRAELDGIHAGKIQTPQQKREDREADRQARIRAQAPERGARTQEATTEQDDELTPAEQYICNQMGITEEAFKARAKKGVQLQWRPGDAKK